MMSWSWVSTRTRTRTRSASDASRIEDYDTRWRVRRTVEVRAQGECQVGVKRVVREYVTRRPWLGSGRVSAAICAGRWALGAARAGRLTRLTRMLCVVPFGIAMCSCGMSPAPCPSIDIHHVATSGYLIPLSSSFHPHRHGHPSTKSIPRHRRSLVLHPHFRHPSPPSSFPALASNHLITPNCQPKPILSQPDAIGVWKKTTPRRSSRRSPTCNPWTTTTSRRSMAGP